MDTKIPVEEHVEDFEKIKAHQHDAVELPPSSTLR